MAKRKTAGEEEPVTPARRQRRSATEEPAQQQEQQQPSVRRSTRRSQQQIEDTAAAAVPPPSIRRSTRRAQQQQQEQEQHEPVAVPEGPAEDEQAEHEQQQEQQEEHEGGTAAAVPAEDAAAAADGNAELDDFNNNNELATAVDALSKAAADPAAFLQPNTDIAQTARQAAKALLQYTVSSCTEALKAAAEQQQQQAAPALADLQDQQQQQQLYIDQGFDSEQVWLQLDMQLAPLRKRLRKLISQLPGDEATGQRTAVLQLVPPDVEAGLDAVLGDAEQGNSSSDDDEDQQQQQYSSDDDMQQGEYEADEQQQDGMEWDEQQQQQGSKQSKRPLLPTEDRFFRLDDMEAFVAEAERAAAGGDGGASDEGESDEPIDYFGGTADSDDEAAAADKADLGSDDAEMEELLNSTAELVGKQRQGKQQQQQQGKKGKNGKNGKSAAAWDASDSDVDSEDDGVDPGQVYYQDFFGPEPGLKQRSRADEDAAAEGQDDSDQEEDDQGTLDSDLDGDLEQDSDLDHDHEGGPGFEFESDDEAGFGAAVAAALGKGASSKKKQVKFAGLVDQDDGPARSDSEDDDDEEEEEQPLSTHEKRLQRMQERIAEYEEAAMGEKPWHLVGEVQGSQRPLNSALEIDMDYETTNKPPPAPTEEATHSLEDLIKRRIAEGRWDDVIRVLPPPAEVKKKQLMDLDDTKAQQGLGELYEQEYVQQATGFTAPDKQEPLRRQAQALFTALCAKLDALSSFAFAPKPVVEELQVRSDVAALALEEVAPLAVSDATLRTPGEVFKAQAKGEAKAEEELTKEERRRRRAKKKRTHKAKEAAKDAEAAARAAATGDATAIAGRKSLAKQLAAATSSGLIKKGVVGGGKSDYGKSTAVFGKIAEQAAAGKAAGKDGKQKGSKEGKQLKGSMLKL